MHILLLSTTFNSLTQAVFVHLRDRGYKVSVLYAVDLEKIPDYDPDMILCPYLKSYLPEEIFENYPTYILHPGPRGDRGASSLEYALEQEEWGVVWLRADEELDVLLDAPVPKKQLLNPLHEPFTQLRRAIDWHHDSTYTIIKKIHQGDSFPGVLDEILGVECHLFGVWREDKFRGAPKEILAKRDGETNSCDI